MFNYLKKIFSIFLIFNLTFVPSAQAAAVKFNDFNGDGTGFSVAAQETRPRSIAFNNDGTKMFVLSFTGQNVNEYTLRTAFDVSNSNVSHVGSFDVSDEEITPTSLTFNNDGTKMFVLGSDGDDVNEYTLGTAFDLSTAAFRDFNGDGNGFSVQAQETYPNCIAFNNDGT